MCFASQMPVAFFAGRTYLNLFVERVPLTPWPFLLSLVAAVFIAWVTVGGQALRAAAVKPGGKYCVRNRLHAFPDGPVRPDRPSV